MRLWNYWYIRVRWLVMGPISLCIYGVTHPGLHGAAYDLQNGCVQHYFGPFLSDQSGGGRLQNRKYDNQCSLWNVISHHKWVANKWRIFPRTCHVSIEIIIFSGTPWSWSGPRIVTATPPQNSQSVGVYFIQPICPESYRVGILIMNSTGWHSNHCK